MAHECPECGQICHCNGDIEDMENQEVENYVNCIHYLRPECSAGDDDEESMYPEETEA